jgi:hypothetical protein
MRVEFRTDQPDHHAVAARRAGAAGLDLDDLVVRRFTGRAGVGRLTYRMLVSAFEALHGDLPAPAGDDLAETIASNVELAVLDRSGVSSDASRAS